MDCAYAPEKNKSKRAGVEDSTRRRIVAAARRIFFAGGFRSVTMDDLARELGMSKKTLYEHFPGKTSLIQAAMLDKLREVDWELEKIASGCSTDFVGALHMLFACIQRHAEEIQSPFLRDMRLRPELFSDIEIRRGELARRYFERLISEGRLAGIIREDIPTGLVTEMMLAALEKIMNPSKLAELDITPRTGYSAIITVILRGVVTEKGRAEL